MASRGGTRIDVCLLQQSGLMSCAFFVYCAFGIDIKTIAPAYAREQPVHDLIGYAQRMAYFAICFIALLSARYAPSVHKCRPQCGGTDTEKAFSPYLYYAHL